jgi:hypothetical protein
MADRNYVELPQEGAQPTNTQPAQLSSRDKWIKYSDWISKNPGALMDPDARAVFSKIGENLRMRATIEEAAKRSAQAEKLKAYQESEDYQSKKAHLEGMNYIEQYNPVAYERIRAIENDGQRRVARAEWITAHKASLEQAKRDEAEQARLGAADTAYRRAQSELVALENTPAPNDSATWNQKIAEKRAEVSGLATAAGAARGRVRVVGPNGQTGTVMEGVALPSGWKYESFDQSNK